MKPLSLAGNRRGQSLWASQNRTPEERTRIRAIVLTIRFLESLKPAFADAERSRVELGWRRGEVWACDQRVLQSIQAQPPTPEALPIKHANGDDTPFWINPEKVGQVVGMSTSDVAEKWTNFRD